MRVGDAARRVGTSTRMLRYAEQLGLVAPPRTAAGYRDYGERDLRAAAEAVALQARYQVTPAALAFGLRTLEDAEVAGSLRRLLRLRGAPPDHIGPPRPVAAPRPGAGQKAALDFETAKARRLLRLAS
jgi:MerR family transcriptional regulator, copper efflux regulator